MKRIDVSSAGLYEISDDELLAIQNMMLDMMGDLAEECERHGIAWSLCGGNLLGCVRGNAFLPWDDDIDVFMTRENYEKLKTIFDEKLSQNYTLREPGDPDFLMQFPKIYRNGTTAQSILSNDRGENGLAIDVFILENTFDNPLRRTLHGIQCTIYLFIISMMRTERCRDNLLKYSEVYKELNSRVRIRLFLAHLFRFRTVEEWLARGARCFSKVKNNHSRLVASPSGTKRYFGEMYDREKMCTLKKEQFCGKEAFIMQDTDHYLRKRYGPDYMVPPPEGQEERHVYVKFDLNQAEHGEG